MSQSTLPTSECLISVIRTQTEIAKASLDLRRVMEIVVRRAQEATRAYGAVIELLEGDELVYRAASGSAANWLGMRIKQQGSLAGLCVLTQTALCCDDSETDLRVDREACRKVGVRSMIVVPLQDSNNIVGVLKVFSPAANAFERGDLVILELMSELIATSMNNAVEFENARMESQAHFVRATHDPLTGIANRALFHDRLLQALLVAKREKRTLAVLLADMDGLKGINDSAGHRVGDAAIKETALRMKRVTRESDTVARIGGDEFAFILIDVQDRLAAKIGAGRIKQSVSAPFQFENSPIALDVSIGIALYSEDGRDPSELLESADDAMYVEKRAKPGHAGR